jgi:superfamily II DNA or RNA helicase
VRALQPDQGCEPGVIEARGWQVEFLARHAAHADPYLLLVATPGAGKTLAACQALRDAEQIVVVCPTTALRAQWADAADRVGLHLDPRWRNAEGAWRSEVDGVVVTCQQVAAAPDLFAHHLARPTFVVHQAGESATWGTALRAAFDGATHGLALSGTPFRSDARAIPFVRYDDERRCAPDFVYRHADAPLWLVAVDMVSEGVDVPRLILAAYATVKRTDLFFRQAVVRRRPGDPDDLVATVFLRADPMLTGGAERVEVELDAGLDFLRSELAKLARDYPEHAERLRIPGSVEGIDRRLGAATGDRHP